MTDHTEKPKRCSICHGRGYIRCDCWPGDCICGWDDEPCEYCCETGVEGGCDQDDDHPDEWDDQDDDGFDECGLTDDGTCMLAGTEHCDWDCPHSR